MYCRFHIIFPFSDLHLNMKNISQYRYPIVVLVLVFVGLGFFFISSKKTDMRDPGSSLFAMFKKYCQVKEGGLFEDSAFGFRFRFNDDVLVCDYQPPNRIGNNHEIYLWNKAAFYMTEPMGFGQGIIGKISINPLPGLPSKTVIAEKEIIVAGISTTVKTTRPPMCSKDSCPTALVAEIQKGGNNFVLEEYNPHANLLESFEFISEK